MTNLTWFPCSRWPNGEIPYTIASSYSSNARAHLAKALQDFHDRTCLRFVPRDASRHRDYVAIMPTGDGCYSHLGRKGGRQELSLDTSCLNHGTIIHELMHAIGFVHEQSQFKGMKEHFPPLTCERGGGDAKLKQVESLVMHAVASINPSSEGICLNHSHWVGRNYERGQLMGNLKVFFQAAPIEIHTSKSFSKTCCPIWTTTFKSIR